MKRYIILSLLGFSALVSHAQDINDALRYSQTNLGGTARFRAMGGAFTALGGDLSAITINPASSVIFNNNQAGFTLSNYNVKNNSEYFGTATNRKENTFDINQAGAVFVFYNTDQESKWHKFSLGINYDNLNSFADNSFVQGTNPNNSIGDYFANLANGIPLDLLSVRPDETAGGLYSYLGEDYGLQHQTAFLGYETYVIDPVDYTLENTLYYSNIPSGSYRHTNQSLQSGYNSKVAFNFATQYTDRFHFGVNLNAHAVNYERVNTFYESNNNQMNELPSETIREVQYRTHLYTYGGGFSFQLGGIARITDDFRLGLSYDSPTWYRLNDELTQRISTKRINTDEVSSGLLNAYFNEGIINIFPEYKLQTPAKYTIGGAYVFGTTGLISVDYAIKDYSSAKLKPADDASLEAQNNLMSEVLDVAQELRIGGEAKVKNWSFRGGYNYEQSPYKNGRTIGDLQQYSLGLGYNFGATKLDLAYTNWQREYNQSLFTTGLTDASKVKVTNNNVYLTMLFEF